MGAIALALLAPTAATAPLGSQTRISFTGADGDETLEAVSPSVAYNPVANQYLVAWSASDVGGDEIFARLVDAAGAPVGAQFRISDMGPPMAAGFDAGRPAVAYNARRNEYLVVWSGDDSAGPLVDDEFEIFAQRLSAAGAELGANDRRISEMGPNGDTAYFARGPAIAYNPTSDEFLVAWSGPDNAGALVAERARDLRPATERVGRPGGRQRPARVRHGAGRRHRLLRPGARRRPRPGEQPVPRGVGG